MVSGSNEARVMDPCGIRDYWRTGRSDFPRGADKKINQFGRINSDGRMTGPGCQSEETS
jgi:hypothetical protein